MSETPSSTNTTRPPRRVFGGDEASAVDNSDTNPQSTTGSRRPSGLGRISFTRIHRPSFISRWRAEANDEENSGTPKTERPRIPSALQSHPEVYTTPLPTLSMVVLSITMLGEFLCANVSAPFLLFMVESFNQFGDEADVGYWTGILASTFFLTQFLTSLLWATVAAKHGSRVVLFISLLGSSITCFLFGTSTTIEQAMIVRLMQGIFAGAIGVARGSVTAVTDQSNEGRAYAILGFCWGFGGVAGAVVGGSFENPAKKWPGVFADIPLFVNYPYLLPCTVAASVTLTGSFLCLLLGPDCGPRQGAIRLPEKDSVHPTIPEEESRSTTPVPEETTQSPGIVRRLSNKFSGLFSRSEGTSLPQTVQEQPVPLSQTPGTKFGRSRTFSSNRADGSAYGYSPAFRNRLASNVSARMRRGSNTAMSFGQRRDSTNNISGSVGSDLNFAQRLLMANENQVTNIADLWVAAAMNVDNEDPFEESEDEQEAADNENAVLDTPGEIDEAEMFDTAPVPPSHVSRFIRRDSVAASPIRSNRPSDAAYRQLPSGGIRRPSTSRTLRHVSSSLTGGGDDSRSRRYSNVVLPIFAHTGVKTPPAVLEAQQLLNLPDEPTPTGGDTLPPIAEARATPDIEAARIREPSLWDQLPLIIIFQYGLLALHSTTHDQVFYLYLVSKYQSGGLNLNAGHFSQLIAIMCLFQIVYQFYLYPNVGPPRGRFSHLAMFRLGSLLFIPAYLSVILYRVFASADDDGNIVVMAALALSTAIRYCGTTFSYTAVAVLLNYMSPPHIVGYANGIAQSIVSLARFFGPIVGGLLWSTSVQNDPSGYPLGFLIVTGVCSLAIAQSFFIR